MRCAAALLSVARMRLLFAALFALLAAPTAAGATQVSYVDQGQVWVSTLDGAQKRAISGPAPVVNAGESRSWTEQGQSDDGWIVGVARESGRGGAAAPVRVWNTSGTVSAEGTLGYHGAYNNAGLAVPVQLNLSTGGKLIAYTYSDLIYGYPVSTLYKGTWVANSTNPSAEPFDIPSLVGSALVGDSWVGINANASNSDDNVVLEAAGAQGPYSTTFTPWFHATGAWQVDASADDKLVAVIFQLSNSDPYKLALFATPGAGGAVTSSCDVPTVGDVHSVTVAPDGASIAWVDDRGLVVAGTGGASTNPCPFSSAPIVISATGSYPALGATTLATVAPGGSTGGSTGTTPGGSTGTTPTAPTVTLPKTVKASALKTGLKLSVVLKTKGTASATAKVNKTILAKTTVKAKKAGKVGLTLKASKTIARKLATYRGKTLTITVKTPDGTATLTRKLK